MSQGRRVSSGSDGGINPGSARVESGCAAVVGCALGLDAVMEGPEGYAG